MPLDLTSDTWKHVERWANEQVATFGKKLKFPMLGERESDHHRGRISALESLLALSKPQEPTKPPEQAFRDVGY